jgi:hypothetical protein
MPSLIRVMVIKTEPDAQTHRLHMSRSSLGETKAGYYVRADLREVDERQGHPAIL